ncbi:hypothetical protein ZWY2020_059692 [Hordeum vulgare]|nr:hypothetical protein ZWY2020_059692 [Hordeum vulgare]
MPPCPARSGAGRGGGRVKRDRSLTNAASAQTGGHIDLDYDEEGFYWTNSNMLQNSDEEEDDSDEDLMRKTTSHAMVLQQIFVISLEKMTHAVPWAVPNKRDRSSSKRASNIGTTGESPSKKTKSPMVKALRGLVNEIKIDTEEGKKKEDNYAKREEARSREIVNAQAQIMVQKCQAIQEEMDQCVALANREEKEHNIQHCTNHWYVPP